MVPEEDSTDWWTKKIVGRQVIKVQCDKYSNSCYLSLEC